MRMYMVTLCVMVLGSAPAIAKKDPKAASADDARKRAEEEKLKAAAEQHHENGMLLVKAREYEQGCEELRAAIAIYPVPVYYVHLGWCYVRLGKRDEAAQSFRNYASEIRPTEAERADWAMDMADLIDQLPALSVPAEVKKSARELWEFAVTVDIPDKGKADTLKRMAERLLRLVSTDMKASTPVATSPAPAPTPTTAAPTPQVTPASEPPSAKPPVESPAVLAPEPPKVATQPVAPAVTVEPEKPTAPTEPAPKAVDVRKLRLKLAAHALTGFGGAALLAAAGLQTHIWGFRVPEIKETCGPACDMDPRIAGVRTEYSTSLVVGGVGIAVLATGIVLEILAR